MIKRHLYPVSHLLTAYCLQDEQSSPKLDAQGPPGAGPTEHLPVPPLLPSLHPSWARLLPILSQAVQFLFQSPGL